MKNNNIHALRKLEVKLDVSGTATLVGNTKLYKDSFGFVLLQVYVPVTQCAEGTPLCTVHRIITDERGNRKVFNQKKFNLLYVDKTQIEGKEYFLFESPLPKQFTDTVGELDLVFNYTEVNAEGNITARLASNLYHTNVDYGGMEGGDVELSLKSQEAAQINANTIAIESLIDSVDDLLKPPDNNEANNVGIAHVELTDEGQLKFIELKGEKGETGEPFAIAKTYVSVEEMDLGYATDSVQQGQFVVINTGEVNNVENAKLYLKGATRYEFLTDLSIGAKGDVGEKGETGQKGDVGLKGETGQKGDIGQAATISVGTITTLPSGSSANIVNSGDSLNAVFDFGIPIGDKGEAGVSNVFDKYISTQEEFEELIASPTWLDARSVVFVGNGGTLKFTVSAPNNIGIKIPNNVYSIHGIANAHIEITNAIAGLSCIGRKCSISDLNITCTSVEGRALIGIDSFKEITNSNVNVTASSSTGRATGYARCHNLTNCTATCICKGTGQAIAFQSCTHLINCEANVGDVQGTFINDIVAGYDECKMLLSCKADAYGMGLVKGFSYCNDIANSTSNCYGKGTSITQSFRSCEQLVNCISYCTNTETVAQSNYAYAFCKMLVNCRGVGKGNNGYGYYSCSYLNGCAETSLTSTTAFTGGAMLYVDTTTVAAK